MRKGGGKAFTFFSGAAVLVGTGALIGTAAPALAAGTTSVSLVSARTGTVLSVSGSDSDDVISVSALRSGYQVSDTTATVVAGAGCHLVNAHTATCGPATSIRVTGGTGDDRITNGTATASSLEGGPGDDTLIGGPASDQLLGGLGSDVLDGHGGADRMDGGAGRDRVSYASHTSGVTVDLYQAQTTVAGEPGENDTLIAVEDLTGTAADDELVGEDQGPHTFDGLGGADTLEAKGPAVLNGGPGGDEIQLFGAGGTVSGGGDADDISAELATAAVTINGDDGDDAIEGSPFADTINGGQGNDDIHGGLDSPASSVDNDSIHGGPGSDALYGGRGQDELFGDAGFDFLNGGSSVDACNVGADGGTKTACEA